jgi:hypothetical protein
LSSPAFAGCSNSALKRMQIHGWVFWLDAD